MLIARIKQIALSTLLCAVVSCTALPAVTLAASASKNDACAGLSQLDSSQDCGSSASNNAVAHIASLIVQTLSIVIGIAAIVMIIIAGFRFITSNGDSNSVAGAKSSLIYALVGLLIATLAQFLVHFVLSRL